MSSSGADRVKSPAHFVRAIAFLVLGVSLLLAALIPLRKGNAQSTTTTAAVLEVIVLVDNSKPVGEKLNEVKAAAVDYINQLPENAEVGVIRYGGFPSIARRMSTNRAAAVAAVTGLQRDGDPTLFDGIDLAIEQFPARVNGKRQILLVGTGANVGSTLGFREVQDRLLQLSIKVDSVGVLAANSDFGTLDKIASYSGGLRFELADRAGLASLAANRSAWANEQPPGAEVLVPIAPKSKSKLLLVVGLLLLAVALVFAVKAALKLKGKKVDLLGSNSLTEVTKEKKAATPISGVADRLTGAADKVLEKQGKNRSIGASLERAGINLKPGEFLIVCAVVLAVFFALLLWKKGITVAAIATVLLAVVGPSKYVKRRTNKRSSAFGDQLSDTLQLLSSSLRAGQGLMQAVDSVAREAEAPASEEFKRVVTETRLGRDLVDSLRSMADRIRSEDFNWVIPAIEINREVGGDLAEVLDTVAGTIRDRADIRRQVKTLSAEGRLSAYVLLSLPIGIFLFINMTSPDYTVELKHAPGLYLLIFAAVLMVIGAVWLFKLCKIEF